MKRESLVFGIAGTFFGVLIGWILGSQQTGPAQVATTAAPAEASAAPGRSTAPPPLDVQRAADLEKTAKAQPASAAVRVELGNVYFDAERFDLAIPWYEAAVKLDPKNVDASTDLGVCYYYAGQIDRALTQLDHSLSIDARHAKTLLNQGIVRAFGKQDLTGAAAAWEKVVAIAPDSEEGRRAKQGLEGLKSGHAGTPAAAGKSGGL